MDRWGSEPMRLRLPMIGHGHGPGGKLRLRRQRLPQMKRRRGNTRRIE